MKKLLVGLAIVVMTLAGMNCVAKAEERTWQLYGLFCNDVKSLNTVIENIDFFPLLRPIEPITQYFYTQTVLSGTVEREAL